MTKKVKKILITGGNGFVGSNFLNYSKKMPYKVFSPNHKELDLLNLEQIQESFDLSNPDVVINFAAHRNANSAELQRNNLDMSAWKTNVEGVKNLDKISSEFGSFFIHISTDMIFSGSENNPGPYDEDDKPETNSENLSWYGWTKAEGERIVMKNKRAAIIRIGNVTQPIYDPKLDYIGKILYLFDQGKIYHLFDNQYLTLSYIPSVLESIEKLITRNTPGVFHVASKDILTPYKLGEYLIKKARGKTDIIKGISINEYLNKFPNRYPKYGGLLADKTAHQLGVKLLNWKEIVDLFVEKTQGYRANE